GLALHSAYPLKLLRRARGKLHNLARGAFPSIPFAPLPMLNYFDMDMMLRRNRDFAAMVRECLNSLVKRGAAPWVDIDKIWAAHMGGRAHYGDAIMILFSLEMNLQGLEKQTATKQQHYARHA